MALHRVGLYWFSNDLRVTDNPLLAQAANECQQLLCLYVLPPELRQPNRYGLRSLGDQRWRFLQRSLSDLHQQLQARGQQLLVLQQNPLHSLAELISQHGIAAIYFSQHAGYYERRYQQLLRQRYPFMHINSAATHTLFDPLQLPFKQTELPDSFSKFRRLLETANLRAHISPAQAAPLALPRSPLAGAAVQQCWQQLPAPITVADHPWQGGSSAGLVHLQHYFASAAPQHYKETRNALDDWSSSTKFSAWLADGSLSVRQVLAALAQHEQQFGANDSTYWIWFELLWREYFQWYAHAHGKRLFNFAGLKQHGPSTSFYPARFQKWCSGNTPYPLVNACMRQLNQTGYMSNRGRQLVASCLVHELQLDWRYGAAYFEQQLIDYDVAANWGNWQYLAGVGADPRGHRRFDLDKQARQFDPHGQFIRHWGNPSASATLDHCDAADWPINE